MDAFKIEKVNKDIAVIRSNNIIITDVQSAIDLIASVNYEFNCNNIIIDKSAICENFFDLKTKLAGEILQKFINYNTKIAIVGDFSIYSSKSLRDFVFESNNGKCIFFVFSEAEGIDRLNKSSD